MGKEGQPSKGLKILEHFIFQCISLKQEINQEGMNFDFLTAYMEKDYGDHDQLTAELEISDNFLRDTAINLLATGKDTKCSSQLVFLAHCKTPTCRKRRDHQSQSQ